MKMGSGNFKISPEETEKQKQIVIADFLGHKDNGSPAIAKRTGIPCQRVDYYLSQYFKK